MANGKTNPAPYGIGPQGQSGGAGSFLADALSGAGELLQNKNLLKAMSQAGTLLDPEGAGGVIGQPTTQWIKTQSEAEASEKQGKISKERLETLIPMLGGKVDYDEQGKVKSITGSQKMTPQALKQALQELGGNSGLGGLGGLDGLSGTGATSSASPDPNDEIESILDGIMTRFGIGGE